MKKILFMLAISLSFLSAINVQNASKEDLMCIKGIGDKKASAIIKYRKSHKLKSSQDLLEIKGFGKVLVKNVEKDIKSIACGGKKSSKKSVTKKSVSKKSTTKKSETKKSTTEKSTTEKSEKKITKKKESKQESEKSSDSKS